MVSLSDIAVYTIASRAINGIVDRAVSDDDADATPPTQTTPTETETKVNGETKMSNSDALDRLVAFKEKNEPVPGAVDAYASQTIDLPSSSTAEIEVSPGAGFDLFVSRATFDRRTDHDYKILIDGERFSVNHALTLSTPRKMTQGGKLVATVTNNSGTASELDFEFEGWGVPP